MSSAVGSDAPHLPLCPDQTKLFSLQRPCRSAALCGFVFGRQDHLVINTFGYFLQKEENHEKQR